MKKNGLLLVNLGSPKTPTTPDVKAYLKEFLSDTNVIEMPPAIWQPILRGFVLPLRSWRSATFYRNIWTSEGSPIITNTQKITNKVQELLPNWNVQMAMNYGKPSIPEQLAKLQKNCEQILVLSLFPHFTKSTTQTIIDKVKAFNPQIKIIDHFYQEDAYLKTLAKHIQTAWDQGNYDRLFLSYHGIPTAMVKHGDPYQNETESTTTSLIRRLNIPKEKIKMVYQSKFGPLPWLKPYLKNTLLSEAQLGQRNILIATPSFVADCLETLEENNTQNYQAFRENGGNNLDLVPALNDDPEFVQFIANLAQREEN